MYEIQILRNGRWVTVQGGFRTQDDAEWATALWRQANRCTGAQFRAVKNGRGGNVSVSGDCVRWPVSYSYCPICGEAVNINVSLVATNYHEQHRCSERTLRGIDATMPQERTEDRAPSFGSRLADGFAMMGDD